MPLESVRERINVLMQQQREEAQQPTSRALLEDNADQNIEPEPLDTPTSESPDETPPIEIPESNDVQTEPMQPEPPGDMGAAEGVGESVRSESDGEPDLPDSPVEVEKPVAAGADGSESAVAGEDQWIDVPEDDQQEQVAPDLEWPEEMLEFEIPEVQMPEDDVFGRMMDESGWQAALLDRAN